MRSIQVDGIQDHIHWKNESVDMLSTGQADCDGFRSFKVVDLEPDQPITSTGMRDEILLLSWLIVLMRTREGSQISYDWAYKCRANGFKNEPVNRCLSMDEVMTRSQSAVGQIAAVIARHITTVEPRQRAAMPGPASLLLSTSSLSQKSEETNDEVSE